MSLTFQKYLVLCVHLKKNKQTKKTTENLVTWFLFYTLKIYMWVEWILIFFVNCLNRCSSPYYSIDRVDEESNTVQKEAYRYTLLCT